MFHSLSGPNLCAEFPGVGFVSIAIIVSVGLHVGMWFNFTVLSSRATVVSEDLLLESVTSNYHPE